MKLKKNASDILTLENKLQQKEDTINENERGLSFNRGFFYYLECELGSFNFPNKKKKNIKVEVKLEVNYSDDSSMKGIEDTIKKSTRIKK